MNKKSYSVLWMRIQAWDILFLVLLGFNILREMHHAMWRDELQIFLLGAHSGTPFDLWENLRYEGHGILWDGMVWGIAHITSDPAWMQVAHAVIAAGIWLIVYYLSPFTRLEKFLLLLSYFLFFEYFVISRNYALAVLCGLGFVTLRQHRPASVVLPWLLLGLMANLAMHATIWSIALAAVLALEEWRRLNQVRFLMGGVLYIVLLVFGVLTMIPAPDYAFTNPYPIFNLDDLNNTLATMVGAFLPISPEWPRAVRAFLSDPQAPVPFFWNPLPVDPVVAATGADILHPLRLTAFVAAPLVLCWLLARRRVLEFSLAYVGIMLFAVLWHFLGSSRHNGMVFAAFVGAVWAARAGKRPSWLFIALLGVNAVGGLMTLGSEFNIFSQARNAAHWIQDSKLTLPLIGQRDAQVSSVAGYLGRPVYYLECECRGTFIVWNTRRQSPLSDEEFRARLARALDHEGRDAMLIRNSALSLDDLPENTTATLLASFTGAAAYLGENYWIYRVTGPG